MTNATQDKTPNAVEETGGWRPEAGDTLSGTIHSVAKGWSEWTSSEYPVVTLRTPSGTLVDVHAFHEVLYGRLLELRPKVGDRLEITYVGKQPTKDRKREYDAYKVSAPDATGAEVWQDLGGARGRAARSARPQPTQDELYGETLPE